MKTLLLYLFGGATGLAFVLSIGAVFYKPAGTTYWEPFTRQWVMQFPDGMWTCHYNQTQFGDGSYNDGTPGRHTVSRFLCVEGVANADLPVWNPADDPAGRQGQRGVIGGYVEESGNE